MNPKRPRTEEVTLERDDAWETPSHDSVVVSAVQRFLSALQSGHAPDRKQFAAQFPEIASELEKCLEGLELVQQAAANLSRVPDFPPPVNAAPNRLGDYRLLREIGRGGMGVVYEAVQISLNRRVAVKVLPFADAIDRTHVQRFRNEAQAAAQLHHANIVPVYAVGDERGFHYYAMQFIDGQPLSRVIAQLRQQDACRRESSAYSLGAGGRAAEGRLVDAVPASVPMATTDAAIASRSSSLTPGMPRSAFFRAVAELIRQAAEALDYAHQFGVVHRDIKPANLLVDGQGTLWVADFGLAHIQADASLTRTGDVLGTVAYMSPEQASGNRPVLDHRTDVYSLGVTLFELLTLEQIFPPSDRHVLLRRIIEEEPRPPRRVNPDIPVELEIIIAKAIAKDPQQRYGTAGQFADDLRRWINDEPILAQPPTRMERLRKWSRRHRSLVRAAGAFALLGFLGSLVGAILIAAEQSKTNAAYQAEKDQRILADKSFRQARQAVDAFVQLGEEDLASNPIQRTLRRKFLETALAYYHEFINLRRDDPNVQAELAASSARVAQLIDELAVLEDYAPLMFLKDVRVGKELGLARDQGDEIARRLAELARGRDDVKNGKVVGNRAARQHQLAVTLREEQKAIVALLTDGQMVRLKQIAWQQQGPLAFENTEVVEALRLTDDQRSQIAVLIAETRPQPGEAAGPKPPERRGPPPERRPGPRAEQSTPPDDLADSRPNRPRSGPPFPVEDPLGRGPAGAPRRRDPRNRRGPADRRPPEDRDVRPDDLEDWPSDFADRPDEARPDQFGGPAGELGPRGRLRSLDGEPGPSDDLPERRPPGRGPAGRGEPAGKRHMLEARKFVAAKVIAILSDEQRRIWDGLIGEPFDVDLEMRPEDWSPH